MAGRRLRPDGQTVMVLVVGLVLTAVLTWASSSSNASNEDRLLKLQVRQAVAAIDAAIVPTIQTPLVSAYELATTGGGPVTFKKFISPYVGPIGPFVSVSLFQLGGPAPITLGTVGQTPELLSTPGRAASVLAHATPGPTFRVTTISVGGDRRLGYFDIPPGGDPKVVIYAESVLPSNKKLVVPRGSAFADLNFALYLGSRQSPTELMETSIRLPITSQTVVGHTAFGNTVITIVGTPVHPLEGGISVDLPWIALGAGSILSVAAALVAERLVRRREYAERLARENQRLYGEQRGIAEALQHALLPSTLPEFAGLQIAVRYVAGVDTMEIGGDWYDVIRLDDTHCFFVIGDVSGRGLAAATTMASLRYAIRAYVAQGDAPETVLGKLGELVSVRDDGQFATILCGVVDIAGHRVVMANAGHPPPLVVADGEAAYASAPPAPPIGVPGSTLNPPTATVDIPPGATLLAYTDGLVERRSESLDVGLDRLRRAAAEHQGTLDGAIGHLLEALVPRGSDDDLAILGIRWTT